MQTIRKKDRSRTTANQVRARIEAGGERLWRFDDFRDHPFTAVAQALSRMVRNGELQRLSKGTYYRPRQSKFGPTLPNQANMRSLVARSKTLFPAGVAAANQLGFTTQIVRQGEISTPSASLPRKLIGTGTKVYTRRPDAWKRLTVEEAAILDFLRRGGKDSELAPEETVRRIIDLLSKADTYAHLTRIIDSEPPRIRALLGALGEQLGAKRGMLDHLRKSLNPSSRFDFGIFTDMPNAKAWQAKGAH